MVDENLIRRFGMCLLVALVALVSVGCAGRRVGQVLERRGQEIVIAGQLVHVGAPVVLWTDPGGYDAYRVEKRFAPWAESDWDDKGKTGPQQPLRYGIRKAGLSETEFEMVRGGGWSIEQLRERVDQFVMHYDVCGTSRTCFRVLHDQRYLSVHFMLDLDGTIYQTLDVKERAWHATISNDRSVGIEIANMGAYSAKEKDPFAQWYAQDEKGTRITIPTRLGDGGIRTPSFVGRPARPEPVVGTIGTRELRQYDLTPQQYASLIKLTAALHKALPKIALDYPRDKSGNLINQQLSKEQWQQFQGVLGHYHVQGDKADPGPAFDWDQVVNGARREVGLPRLK
ncbi:MAG: peptidoglycan recognition protein family protein [Planctomycetes bacterium]|nr:peptidoglycan recognition protein family protein [Planctomycetota bacterium]